MTFVVGASNTGSLQERVLLLACYIGEHVTRNTAHVAPLTSAKEVAVNSSKKPKRESHTAPRGTHSPSLRGAASFTWLHPEPGEAVGPEGDTWSALCQCPAYPSQRPTFSHDGTSKAEAAWSWHSGFSKATVLGSSCPLLASGGHQTGIQAWVKMLEGTFRTPLLICQRAPPPSPSRRRSCGRCSGRCPRC